MVKPRLHDVDLAAGSPGAVNVILWKHPNSWPKSFSLGQFGTHSDPETEHLSIATQ